MKAKSINHNPDLHPAFGRLKKKSIHNLKVKSYVLFGGHF